MKRIHSKAALLRKRVKTVQGRAKFTGFLYLLGTIALLAVGAVVCPLSGTCLTTASGLLPVLQLVEEIKALFTGDITNVIKDGALLMKALILVLYIATLLALLINTCRSFGKLGWLFKRRASYANGFNRNMYAMDDLGKRFSGSLAALVIFYVFAYLFTDGEPKFTMYGYIALGAGLALHIFCGLLEGKVTLFTTGEKIEEEEREYGLFVFFLRNLVQIAAVGAIVYFFAPVSTFGTDLKEVLDKLVVVRDFAWLKSNITALIPFLVELVAWICMIVLIKHATAATEYNRDCLDGDGMKNFAVFAFFAALCFGAIALLPYLGVGVATGETAVLNTKALIATGVAFAAFLFDCIVRPRHRGGYDDLDVDAYFGESYETAKYNNTII
ncbi:MAG: hypothetical protein IJX91_05765 [Clostridia bacterium]|nr:hypothetical protein [Clostridia bacterium]